MSPPPFLFWGLAGPRIRRVPESPRNPPPPSSLTDSDESTSSSSSSSSSSEEKQITVEITSTVTTVEAGKTITLTAAVTNGDEDDKVTWTSGDTSVATIDANGVLTGVKAGKVTVTEAPKPVSVEITGVPTGTIYTGQTIALSAKIENGGTLTPAWSIAKDPTTMDATIDAATGSLYTGTIAGKITVKVAVGEASDTVLLTITDLKGAMETAVNGAVEKAGNVASGTVTKAENYSGYPGEPEVAGVFYGGNNVTPSELADFKAELAAYGFVKSDEIRDTGGSRHEIYSYDGCVVDMLIGNAMFGSGNHSVQMWVYRGELIQGERIEEVLEETVGDFFALSDFVKPENSYSADYGHFALLNFAGNDFSEEAPLHCFTIDLDYNGYQDVYNGYREKGYSFYRNADGTIYTYITRGSSHYVMYKGDGENRVYVDLAYYPTSDYTYAGHDEYSYRIEAMIYQSERPLSAITSDSLSEFEEAVVSYYGESARFAAVLPSGSKVELLKPTYTYEFLEYGYYNEPECFIYGNVESIYSCLVEALESAGYSYAYTGKQSVTYRKTIDADNYRVSSIVLMKNADRGFVRVINGTPGKDF